MRFVSRSAVSGLCGLVATASDWSAMREIICRVGLDMAPVVSMTKGTKYAPSARHSSAYLVSLACTRASAALRDLREAATRWDSAEAVAMETSPWMRVFVRGHRSVKSARFPLGNWCSAVSLASDKKTFFARGVESGSWEVGKLGSWAVLGAGTCRGRYTSPFLVQAGSE